MPGTGSGDSRSGPGCCCRSSRSCRNVNRFLRGWAGYFRYGNSALLFAKISDYALMRLALCRPNGTNAAERRRSGG